MRKTVFVVDDEKTIADTLAAILENRGYQAYAFYNAETALEKCDALVPDLVISDVVMPGMNGAEMAVAIRNRHPMCKILLFSGQAATADMLVSVREQGHEFELLAKPIHPKDLLARIDPEKPRPVGVDLGGSPTENVRL
jgi:DNA-binding response OmpR family regulator